MTFLELVSLGSTLTTSSTWSLLFKAGNSTRVQVVHGASSPRSTVTVPDERSANIRLVRSMKSLYSGVFCISSNLKKCCRINLIDNLISFSSKVQDYLIRRELWEEKGFVTGRVRDSVWAFSFIRIGFSCDEVLSGRARYSIVVFKRLILCRSDFVWENRSHWTGKCVEEEREEKYYKNQEVWLEERSHSDKKSSTNCWRQYNGQLFKAGY